MDSEDILSNFRHEWRREIQTSGHRRGSLPASEFHGEPSLANASESGYSSNRTDAFQSEIEHKAADLFAKGIQLEQNGKFYESITYYRRAISLVPDIEFRVYQQTIGIEENTASGPPRILDSEDANDDDEDDESIAFNDLTTKFETLLGDSRLVCRPHFPQDNTTHISCLPIEMFEKIISWIVGEELDLESLERLGLVSRGFFLLSRKPDLWKRSCVRVWGVAASRNLSAYTSWREMFIWCPRPRFNGCYIARTTYLRSGEISFQDHSSQPWHIVSYYRYFRFFPNGCVLMLTSSEEPQSVIGQLRSIESKHSQALLGRYRMHENSLTLMFRTNNSKKKHRFLRTGTGTTDVIDTTWQMELEVKGVRDRPHWKLWWKCYSVVSYVSGEHTTSVVNVSDTNNFPPFSFSKVRSYTSESEQPLP